MRRLSDIVCIFLIQLKSMRAEIGPFLLAGLVFPSAMYLFATAVSRNEAASEQLRFLAGSIVFSLSLTSISWLGYLLLENRFTGRLKLFATVPLSPSSYVCGFLVFAFVQAAIGTTALLMIGRFLGVQMRPSLLPLAVVIVLTVLCLCGLGAVIAARARSFTQGSLLTDALGAGLIFLAPVYYPAELMPRGLRTVAEFLPTTFAARGVESALEGRHQISAQVIVLALMAIATLSLGFGMTKWREN
ncbi:MAG TPA: ABC transporter permease [Pyrinomonadaceae bacterium]